MKNGEKVDMNVQEIKVKTNKSMFMWLAIGMLWTYLVFGVTEPGSLTQHVQMFAGATAYLNVVVQYFNFRKSAQTAYRNISRGFTNRYSDTTAINAFTGKYKSPLSRWSMKLFGREPERILLSKYAVKERTTGALYEDSGSSLTTSEKISLEPGKENFSLTHPWILTNYLAMTPQGLQIEQELEANPLMLWDSALKDVSKQYGLDSYFTAKKKKEVASQVSQSAIESILEAKRKEKLMEAFEGLYTKQKAEDSYLDALGRQRAALKRKPLG